MTHMLPMGFGIIGDTMDVGMDCGLASSAPDFLPIFFAPICFGCSTEHAAKSWIFQLVTGWLGYSN